MTQKVNVQSLPVFSLAEQLKTEEDIATYLELVLENGNSFELEYAANVATRARQIYNLKISQDNAFVEPKK